MISSQLRSEEYNSYYKSYIDNATDESIIEGLK